MMEIPAFLSSTQLEPVNAIPHYLRITFKSGTSKLSRKTLVLPFIFFCCKMLQLFWRADFSFCKIHSYRLYLEITDLNVFFS